METGRKAVARLVTKMLFLLSLWTGRRSRELIRAECAQIMYRVFFILYNTNIDIYIYIYMTTDSYKYTYTHPILISIFKRLGQFDLEIHEVG
jgi:hypothetical protein